MQVMGRIARVAVMAFMPAAWAAAPVTAPTLFAPERVNDTQTMTPVGPKAKGPHVLRAQILLDRARFSPGEIDGAYGSNMEKAIAAYQRSNRLTVSGTVDAPTWAALNRDPAQALVTYRIAEADVAGPFTAIPSDMIEKAKLPALGYASALEALGEKFHASPRLLRELNADKDLSRAGVDMLVPNVDAPAPLPKAAKVIVDKSDSSVTLVDAAGTTLAHFPASTGSQHDPLPLGLWKINGVARNPVFHYNPKLFWDAKAGHEKARIPAGPNNPVGVVWVDLSKDHYGIHGTPDPSRIGKTQSHGCIRLTNWDARALADAVGPGTPALLQE